MQRIQSLYEFSISRNTGASNPHHPIIQKENMAGINLQKIRSVSLLHRSDCRESALQEEKTRAEKEIYKEGVS